MFNAQAAFECAKQHNGGKHAEGHLVCQAVQFLAYGRPGIQQSGGKSVEEIEDSKYMPNRDKRDEIDDLEDEINELEKRLNDVEKNESRKYFLTKVTPKKKLKKNAEAFMAKYKKDSFIEDGWGRGVR